ncbi:MAG: serine/threonine-protein kinase [Deltaproteobacteria bacterium]|nr:serine/threonine-protein kinase [Deltaproteobacteria bacterium]
MASDETKPEGETAAEVPEAKEAAAETAAPDETRDERRPAEGSPGAREERATEASESVPDREAGRERGFTAMTTKRRYAFLREHARGGLGEVSVALDLELDREVALKELSDRHARNPQLRDRFLLEAKITGGLEHPGIVPIYGLGTYRDGRPYYAMRLVRGDSLQEAIEALHEQEPPLSFDEKSAMRRRLIRRFISVCEAIAYAHSRGVLHRDIKPANIMLGPYGETLVVDWGLAKIADGVDNLERHLDPEQPDPMAMLDEAHPTDTLQGVTLGTPAFMSPEQALGLHDQLGPASDVFGLGATLYTLLTGRLPYDDSDAPGPGAPADPDDLTAVTEAGALARARKADFARPRTLDRSIPPALESICLKAMAERIPDRYASARGLADDLERWLSGEPVLAHHENLLERVRRVLRRRRTLALVALATFVGSMAVALVAQQEIRRITNPPLEARLVDAGLVLLERDADDDAEPLFREARDWQRQRAAADPTDPLGATVGLALALHRLGRSDEGVALLRELVQARRQHLGPGAFLTASAESALGELLLSTGEVEEARQLIERSHVILERGRADAPHIHRWSMERMRLLRAAAGEPDAR